MDTMARVLRMAPIHYDVGVYGKWCYHIQGLIDLCDFIGENIRQTTEYKSMSATFEPAAEAYKEQLFPPTKAAPEKPAGNSVSTQTEQPSTISTPTDAPPTPPPRTYAAAAVQATPPTQRQRHQAASPKHEQSGEGERGAPQGARRPPAPPKAPLRPQGRARPPPAAPATKERPPTTRALVMHAAPLKYKPGTMRSWLEEDNIGVRIVGIRWLLREDRRGQVASSLVIYMRDLVEVTKLRMGRRLFRTTCYDWDR